MCLVENKFQFDNHKYRKIKINCNLLEYNKNVFIDIKLANNAEIQ